MLAIEIIFWICVGAVLHTYLLYPLFLRILAQHKTLTLREIPFDSDQPLISIVMAAYNEEKVLEEKIVSVFSGNYPAGKIEMLVGSDNSTDRTNSILEKMTQRFSQLDYKVFEGRLGKIKIVNELVKQARGELLLITDANVMFSKDTIVKLVSAFADNKTGLVDTRMMHTGLQKDGISLQEHAYISSEVKVKYHEGLLWGSMMGPFGGCYAIRRSLFVPVPENFLVDDFYINMSVLKQGYSAKSNINALVYEDVSNHMRQEFRRKVRIATGNFQNFFRFSGFLLKPWTACGFCFLSHKVLRWFGPFFLLTALICVFFLSYQNDFYLVLLGIGCGSFILVLPDLILYKSGVTVPLFRYLTHFYLSNIAMLLGFFRFLTGVRSSVWTPTQRHQTKK